MYFRPERQGPSVIGSVRLGCRGPLLNGINGAGILNYIRRQHLMRRLFYFSCFLLLSSTSFASDLVHSAKIHRLASSTDALTDNFYIQVTGGTGPCANGGMTFERSAAPSDGFFNRMFAIAMLAYSTGSTKVRVYTASGTNCDHATFIEIKD